MTKYRKINVKTLLAIAGAGYLIILTFYTKAGTSPFHTAFVSSKDTVPPAPVPPPGKGSPNTNDTLKDKNKTDSIARVDTLKISKDSLEAPIKYSAEDSGVLMIDAKEFILYGKAKTAYKDLTLQAATIRYDQQSQLVKAYGALDTTGNPLSKPVSEQGDMKSISDSIFFNMKTGKGLTKNSYFQEGEIFLNSQVLKKVSVDEVYALRARFTTCNLDTPHYAFRTRKMKIIKDKLGISGPAYPEFEGVPIPIGIPFGIFPLNRGRHSGILPPAFTASEDFGLGLEGLGYYKVLSDNADLTTRANLYSYGGYTLNLSSKYIKRYRYTGSVNVTFQNTRLLNRVAGTEDEFTGSHTFMINWSHTRDTRAHPGTNFGASVNFGSTKFNQLLLNNPYQNFQNQLSSSVSYSKDWNGKYNLSVNLNHNQNSVLRLVNLNLPAINFNVVTFYPFQHKDQIGSGKWYEKIGIGYSGNFLNQFSFYDTAFSFRKLLDTIQYGAQHSIPISLTLPPIGPVTVTPSITYAERWYGQTLIRSWDSARGKVDTTIHRGFFTAREMTFGVGLNTRIFGTYKFPPLSHIIGIRHEVRPSISLSYKPDFSSRYYYNTRVDSSGRQLRFSKFDGSIISAFSEGAFGGINFGIDNLLEMKVKDSKDSTGPGTKKIKLLDGFGFTSSYNLLADSFALGLFSFYARSTLFDKININAQASMDPYAVDNQGYRLKKLLFDPLHFKFGRITGGSVSVSTSFSSKSKNGSKDKQIPIDPFLTPDEQQRQLMFARANPAEFTDFDIPWNISLSYSLNFNNTLKPDFSGFQTITYSSINFNGDFSLTDKWKVGGTGYYDISQNSLQQLSMFITREMHCWQLSINVTPVGLYRSFSITINPKSGILRDLRINRSRTFSSY